MPLDHKIIEKKDAPTKLKIGLDKACNLVKMTLGPMGKNVILEVKAGPTHGTPEITNDGVTIAKHIILEDPTEDLGAQAVIDVALQTDEMVGDATTTSMVLAQAIVEEASSRTEGGLGLQSVRAIKEEIDKATEEVVAQLKKMARPIKTLEDIKRVTICATENEKLGNMIAEIRYKVGVHGFISADDTFDNEITSDLVPGMKFHGTYAASFMITNDLLESIYTDVPILVTNQEINTGDELFRDIDAAEGLIHDCLQAKKSRVLVIIGADFKHDALQFFYNIRKNPQQNFTVLAVKAPSLDNEQLEDIALYTGAHFIDKDKGLKLQETMVDDLGHITKIKVNRDDTAIMGETGNKKEIKERLEQAKKHLEIEETPAIKVQIEKRIASLSGGIGVVRVGARTETEKEYLRLKAQDGVSTSKTAMEEGVVPGGGLVLKQIADKLPQDNILKKALERPYSIIKGNSGDEKFKIGDDIIDSVKAVRTSLQNAASFAGTFITTGGSIAYNREQLEKRIGRMIDEHLRDK